MIRAWFSATQASDVIEEAYRSFLRNTWIALPAFVVFAASVLGRSGVVATNPDGSAKSDLIGLVAFILTYFFLPFMLPVLTLARGSKEFRMIAFGRLSWCQILLFGIALGAFAQFSTRGLIALFGGEVVSANDDPSVGGIIGYFVLTVFLIVISEEVMFRLVLQTYLQRYGTAISIVGTAALFTVFHLAYFDRQPSHYDVLRVFVSIPLPALLFSVARRCSGSLLLTLVIHMSANSFAILGRTVAQLPGCC